MSIFLFVKGPPKSAKRAASRHGVTAKNCRLLKGDRSGNKAETKCEALCTQEAAVSDWYREPGSNSKPGRGFAPGALLFYSNLCGRTVSGRRKKAKR